PPVLLQKCPEFYFYSSLLCASRTARRRLASVRRAVWIRRAGRAHVRRLERAAYWWQSALRQNLNGAIDGNVNIAFAVLTGAVQPAVFRSAENCHIVLVVILQARRFERVA